MAKTKRTQSGFSSVEIVIVVVVLAVVAAIGLLIYQRHEPTPATDTTHATNQQKGTTAKQAQPDPYAGWKTFTDNASEGTSGISVKYPSDWKVDVGSKNYAWKITQTANAQNSIIASYVFADGSKTALQEWEDCGNTDACGGSADDKTLTGSESTVNGLSTYSVTMQNSSGTFHVTVIRGDKSAPSVGTPFVVLKTYTTDQTALSTYSAIVASATFPG